MATATLSPHKSTNEPSSKGRYLPDGWNIYFNYSFFFEITIWLIVFVF